MYVHYVVLVTIQDLSLSFYCYLNPPVEVDMKEFIDLEVAFTENSYCKLPHRDKYEEGTAEFNSGFGRTTFKKVNNS